MTSFHDGHRQLQDRVPDRNGFAMLEPMADAGATDYFLASLEHGRFGAWVSFATRLLLEVYLGANAARRILDGAFRRGTCTELYAAPWFCDTRLDLPVEAMCKTLGVPLLMTSAFATALGDTDVASLGKFELKGVPFPKRS